MNDQDPRQGPDWVEDLKNEISGMAKEGINHPSTPPVLTAAAVGAAIGWALPFVSLPVGLVAGAGFMLYQRIKK
jgi:hypothetical protein